MTLMQRKCALYANLFLQLGFLVYFLEGGFEGNPTIPFCIFWLSDLIIIVVSVIHCFVNKEALSGFSNTLSMVPAFLSRVSMIAVCVCKLLFEVLLYISLVNKQLSFLWVVIPLWLGLTVLIVKSLATVIAFHYQQVEEDK